MPEADYSSKEVQRMLAVQKNRMLGTPAEERFDKITRLARRLFNVPMAAIDIVGEKLAWIKSGQGFTALLGHRKDSYCHHTVLENKICFVKDAREDPRFFDSAFAEQWVFYAGVPLLFDNERIGVLCIGDTSPRDFSKEDQLQLRDLAMLAEQELNVCILSEVQMNLAQKNDELEKQNRIDALTHVWNRTAILDIALTEFNQHRGDGSLAILMIDLDNYKDINDTFGHQAGDQVLQHVIGKIRSIIRPMDALGRYGGDEFLVVLTDFKPDEILEIGKRICTEIANTHILFENQQIKVTCSVGCAELKQQDSIEALIKEADQTLYKAKAAGRGCAM